MAGAAASSRASSGPPTLPPSVTIPDRNPLWVDEKASTWTEMFLDGEDETELHRACRWGDTPVVASVVAAAAEGAPSLPGAEPGDGGGDPDAAARKAAAIAAINMPDSQGRLPLHYAARNGFVDIVRMLLESGLVEDINHGDQRRCTPVWFACLEGRLDVIELFCATPGASLRKSNAKEGKLSLEYPPLWIATRQGHVDVVKRLAADDVAVRVRFEDPVNKNSLLGMAILFGYEELAEVILDRDPDKLSVPNLVGSTPFALACYRGMIDTAKMLDRRAGHADIPKRNVNGATPFLMACEKGHPDIVDWMLSDPDVTEVLDPELGNNDRTSPFGFACESGCLDTVKRLASDPRVDVGSVNVRQCDGLYLAAQSGSTSVVQWLTTDPSVRDRVSVEGRNAKGNTPFSIACAKGHLEIVRHLASLPSMIDCNTRNVNGATPALSACEAGHLEVVQFLMSSEFSMSERTDIEVCNTAGTSPWMFAAMKGQIGAVWLRYFDCHHWLTPVDADVVRYLAEEHGDVVDITRRNARESTAALLAAEAGAVEVLDYLANSEEIGGRIDIDAPHIEGVSPLAMAALNGHLECVKLLAPDARVDVCRRNFHGITPLYSAVIGMRTDVVHYFCTDPMMHRRRIAESLLVPSARNKTPLTHAARLPEDYAERVICDCLYAAQHCPGLSARELALGCSAIGHGQSLVEACFQIGRAAPVALALSYVPERLPPGIAGVAMPLTEVGDDDEALVVQLVADAVEFGGHAAVCVELRRGIERPTANWLSYPRTRDLLLCSVLIAEWGAARERVRAFQPPRTHGGLQRVAAALPKLCLSELLQQLAGSSTEYRTGPV